MRAKRGLPFEDRYIPEPNSGCWIWLQWIGANGYGQISVGNHKVSAHRRSWDLHCEKPADDKWVLHTCDTKACVNPGHLYLGDALDNTKDAFDRGRRKSLKGVDAPSAKLTEDEVRKIRADTRSNREIANSYGLHRVSIAHIRSGKNWRHLA